MRLFSGVVVSNKTIENYSTTVHTCCVYIAENEASALGQAIADVAKSNGSANGWSIVYHAMHQVPDDVILKAAEYLRK